MFDALQPILKLTCGTLVALSLSVGGDRPACAQPADLGSTDQPQAVPPSLEEEGRRERQTAEQVIIRAWAHDDYGRIVFDWPQAVGYTAGIDDRLLTVEFDRRMNTSLEQVRQYLGAYISEVVLAPDGRTLTATLTGDYHLHTFPLRQGSMTKIVLDMQKNKGPMTSERSTQEEEQTAKTHSQAPVLLPQREDQGERQTARPNPQPPQISQTPAQPAQPTATRLQSPPSAPLLTLPLGHSHLLRLDTTAGSIFVGDPDIADVSLVSPSILHLVGKAIGRTSVAALDAAGEMIAAWTVATVIDVGPVQSALEGTQELKDVSVRQLSKGVELSGEVTSSAQADLAVRLAAAALPDEVPVTNRLVVSGAQQVNLEVQIAEMSRSVSEALGINWEAIEPHRPGGFTGFQIGRFNFIDEETGTLVRAILPGGEAVALGTSQFINGTRVTALLDALATAGLVSILARPSLTAISGETASFFSGGEFPLPAGFRDGAITFVYKKFGVLLDFVPTVVNAGRIVLTVRSEVSQRSETESLRAEGLDIPVIDGRRAETTVEVGNGESIVIAGLYRDQSESRESGMPLLKDIPFVNLLFGSRSVRSNATELIIVVTARLTDATSIPLAENREQPTTGLRLRGYYY